MLRIVHTLKRRLVPLLPSAPRRRFMRAYWDARWSQDDRSGPWLDRDISPEIVDAIDNGWFAAGSPALDLGCGRGDVAAFLAGRGFPSVGIDIAPAAVALAKQTHGDVDGRLEFLAADVCAEALPDRRFGVLVDRGCFHQLDARDRKAYAANLTTVAAPNARFLLFVKAFRDGQPLGDAAELSRRSREVEGAFASAFSIDRIAETTLDRHATLPGLVFWLTRQESGQD